MYDVAVCRAVSYTNWCWVLLFPSFPIVRSASNFDGQTKAACCSERWGVMFPYFCWAVYEEVSTWSVKEKNPHLKLCLSEERIEAVSSLTTSLVKLFLLGFIIDSKMMLWAISSLPSILTNSVIKLSFVFHISSGTWMMWTFTNILNVMPKYKIIQHFPALYWLNGFWSTWLCTRLMKRYFIFTFKILQIIY